MGSERSDILNELRFYSAVRESRLDSDPMYREEVT